MNEGGRKQPDDEDEGPAEEKSTTSEEGKRRPVRSRRMQEYIQQQDKTVPIKQRKCTHPGCEKLFSSGPGLRYHLRTHSPTARFFVCDHCSKEFKSFNGLKYHQEKTKCLDTRVDPPAPSSPHSPSLPNTLPPSFPPVNSRVESTPVSTKERTWLDETDSMRDPTPGPPSQDWPEPRHRKMESKRKQLERQAELSKVAGQGQQTARLPPQLEPVGSGEAERLLQFATIATGPQSPLLNKNMDWDRASTLASRERSNSSAGDVGVRTHPSSTATVTSITATSLQVESDSKSLRSASPLPSSPKEWDCPQGVWSHTPVWQCFSKGTKVCFDDGVSSTWYPVETLAMSRLQGRDLVPKDLEQPVPLRLVSKGSKESEGEVQLGFESQDSLPSRLTASCVLHHPFDVHKKGWASCSTKRTREVYGLTSSPLEIHDVCLPPTHSRQPATAKDSEGSEVNSLEYSSVVALSKMAQKRSQERSTGRQPHSSPNGQDVPKAKRPMNAFFLWSQTKRPEYIHKYTRSNREISGMLSKEWHKLSNQEKQEFQSKAKVKAELQKQQYPDCWKRKNHDH
ncbi:HMG box-containing protein 1-like [Littorina saxatilis]|uniref:HMG box-containing protein 1 n=1 Tax=Littorina saxatilis TaxID=31220 RepID=A0AAN9GBG7_9CAEN